MRRPFWLPVRVPLPTVPDLLPWLPGMTTRGKERLLGRPLPPDSLVARPKGLALLVAPLLPPVGTPPLLGPVVTETQLIDQRLRDVGVPALHARWQREE